MTYKSKDCSSLYADLVFSYVDLIDEIDQIFISYGAWADKNSGNGLRASNEPYTDANKNREYKFRKKPLTLFARLTIILLHFQ
jgi:hypothetical protein